MSQTPATTVNQRERRPSEADPTVSAPLTSQSDMAPGSGEQPHSPETARLVPRANEDQTQPPPEEDTMSHSMLTEGLTDSRPADIPSAPGFKLTELWGDKKKQPKKRKRQNNNLSRNVKKKATKSPKSKKADGDLSIDHDPNLSQILGGSLNEMMADSPTVLDPRGASSPADGETQQTRPVRRRGTTRLTAVKQQLREALDENSRLKNAIGLLENDIDAKNKNLIKFRKHDTVVKIRDKETESAYRRIEVGTVNI